MTNNAEFTFTEKYLNEWPSWVCVCVVCVCVCVWEREREKYGKMKAYIEERMNNRERRNTVRHKDEYYKEIHIIDSRNIKSELN